MADNNDWLDLGVLTQVQLDSLSNNPDYEVSVGDGGVVRTRYSDLRVKIIEAQEARLAAAAEEAKKAEEAAAEVRAQEAAEEARRKQEASEAEAARHVGARTGTDIPADVDAQIQAVLQQVPDEPDEQRRKDLLAEARRLMTEHSVPRADAQPT